MIKMNDMINDVDNGYYRIMECVEIEKGIFVTMFNEFDNIIIHLENYNDNTNNTISISHDEFKKLSSSCLLKLINTMNYYAYEKGDNIK